MVLETQASLIKRLRRKPVHDPANAVSVAYGREHLHRLLPHREPFLLIDSIDSIDLSQRTIRGRRRLDPNDPVFAGHFPGTPVYPGVLQVEMIGQLALCLAHFITHETCEVGPEARPAEVRALRIHYAQYQLPVYPDHAVEVHAAILEEDGMTATCAGQVILDGNIASFAVEEVYFVE